MSRPVSRGRGNAPNPQTVPGWSDYRVGKAQCAQAVANTTIDTYTWNQGDALYANPAGGSADFINKAWVLGERRDAAVHGLQHGFG